MRSILCSVAAFVSGIAFVVACGEHFVVGDAAAVDAQAGACASCEKPIDASRIVYRRGTQSRQFPVIGGMAVSSTAGCPESSVLLGGGCWVYSPNATSSDSLYATRHLPVAFGPIPRAPRGSEADRNDQYSCVYEDDEGDRDLIVVATAMCLTLQP